MHQAPEGCPAAEKDAEFWAKRRPTGELLMTAPHARQPEVLPRPACTSTAIQAVLAASADASINPDRSAADHGLRS
jgi:hypothetical protein